MHNSIGLGISLFVLIIGAMVAMVLTITRPGFHDLTFESALPNSARARVVLPPTQIKVKSSRQGDFEIQSYDPTIRRTVITSNRHVSQRDNVTLEDSTFDIDRTHSLQAGDIVTVTLDKTVNIGHYLATLNKAQSSDEQIPLHVTKIERPANNQSTNMQTIWQEHRMTARQLTLTILASLILGLILSLIGFTIQSI